MKIIVFSDQHRGNGEVEGADDFRNCRDIYHAALEHYLESGYELYLLGDVEDLWECKADDVFAAYGDTLALEARFGDRGGYRRFFGNHDLTWSHWDKAGVSDLLGPHLPTRTAPIEGVVLPITHGGAEIGKFFFTHGHQGDPLSDTFRQISEFIVRNLVGPFQRATGIPTSLPSKNPKLRGEHEKKLYRWAKRKRGHILIAGHTHNPFPTKIMSPQEIEAELKADAKRETRADREREIQKFLRQKELLDSDILRLTSDRIGPSGEPPMPCYLNTGCCCFGRERGTNDPYIITGIEIADGQIQLVRWANDNGRFVRAVYTKGAIVEAFERVNAR